jgi:predicted amidohydrolase YtcJ
LLLSGIPVASLAQEEEPAPIPARPAHIVLLNTKIWTLEEEQPVAEAVAIRGQRIIRVGTNEDVRKLVSPGFTRVINLRGRLVLPGFIDNHTHFASAGRLLLGLNLLDVATAAEFRRRVGEAASRLPAGAWLTGGDWGAYAQWRKGSSGQELQPMSASAPEFLPTKSLIDPVTGDHPALISRFDGEVYLANSLALEKAGITRETPDPVNGEIGRDANGEPTGVLRGEAYQLVEEALPPPSREQRLAEARRALEEARRWGVTSIHDNTPDFDQFELFRSLQKNEELTLRVWARMPLSEWKEVQEYTRIYRIPPASGGWGDQYIRLGGLKAWVDGIMGNSTALFFQPYDHHVTVHAIGDKANRILLDTYERVFSENPERDRRFRVVHAQVVQPEDFARFGALNLIAEVQPYHCIDDMRWMAERIGRQRSRGAYAFRSLLVGGATMSFGSDWPGTNASYYPINPLLGIYAAVARRTTDGLPAGGWFPEQRVSIEEAVRAYAAFEENIKGSIREGKLADLVVLDRDILTRPPEELLQTEVLFTFFDGRIVYEKGAAPKPSE